MALFRNNALMIATLLSAAALVCLGVGARLLVVSGDALLPTGSFPGARLVAALTLGGGVVVFLLATVALLAARRYAVMASRHPEPLPEDLTLVDIREWSRELEDIRDDLRRDGEQVATADVVQHQLTVPQSWRRGNRYLLGNDGRPADSLADLKHSRDQLIEAAERVDLIVQSINEITSGASFPRFARRAGRRWFRRWKRR